MTERFQKLRAAFLAARAEMDPAARERLLLDACGADSSMLDELRRMLATAPTDEFLVPPHAEGPVLALPRRLGEFDLLRDISDGRGVVWLAHQASLDRHVAIKVLHAGPATPPTIIERFHREPMAVASLDHPHIIPVYSEGESNHTHWFAMQFVDGHSLDRELQLQQDPKPNTPAPLLPTYGTGGWFAAVARVCAEAADALQAAHEAGIVHRDIKPANLLIDRKGRALVADFGIARVETLGSLTDPGTIAGTWHYMSPEQARIASAPVDHRTDIYSLGVVMYELLTRHRPFGGSTSQEVLEAIRTVSPRPIRSCNPNVPRDLATICMAAMERDLPTRYRTAAELRDDLRRFLQHEAIVRQPPTFSARFTKWVRAHRLLLGSALALLLTLLLGSTVQAALTTMSAQRELEQRCLALRDADDLDASAAAELAALWASLSASPTSAQLSSARRQLERYRDRLLADSRQGLRLLPADDADAQSRAGAARERLVRALGRLSRARGIFPQDPELAAAWPSDPFVAGVNLRAQTTGGQAVAATATAIPIDGPTGMPGPAQDLGRLPCTEVRLRDGMYRFVLHTDDGRQHSFTRTLELLQLHDFVLVPSSRPDATEGMVRIEGGELQLPAQGPPSGLRDHKVTVAPFWIDRCEVTVGEYGAFLEATQRTPPYGWDQLDPIRHARRPVVYVTWDDAVAYAEWAGKRLPSQAEWMIAACGGGARPRHLPWSGTDFLGNCRGRSPEDDSSPGRFAAYLSQTTDVDASPASCTPEGVFEMFGNVEEWTESPAVDADAGGHAQVKLDQRVICGNTWFALESGSDVDLFLTVLDGAGPLHPHFARGFRCVKNVQP